MPVDNHIDVILYGSGHHAIDSVVCTIRRRDIGITGIDRFRSGFRVILHRHGIAHHIYAPLISSPANGCGGIIGSTRCIGPVQAYAPKHYLCARLLANNFTTTCPKSSIKGNRTYLHGDCRLGCQSSPRPNSGKYQKHQYFFHTQSPSVNLYFIGQNRAPNKIIFCLHR